MWGLIQWLSRLSRCVECFLFGHNYEVIGRLGDIGDADSFVDVVRCKHCYKTEQIGKVD